MKPVHFEKDFSKIRPVRPVAHVIHCQISRMDLFARIFHWQGSKSISDNCRIAM